MAKNKKAALLYCDLIYTVGPLTDEEAGRLFKHFLAYINDLDPTPSDRLTSLLFEPIKQTLKRDLQKWEITSNSRSESGRKGGEASGRSRSKMKQMLQKRSKMKQNEHDSDSVIDSVSVSTKVDDISQSKKFVLSWEEKKEEMLNSEVWIESNCRRFRLSKQKIIEELGSYFLHIESQNRTEDSLRELQQYFPNRLNDRLSKEKNGKFTSPTEAARKF